MRWELLQQGARNKQPLDIFYHLPTKKMKNYDNLTIKDINQLLKKSDFYFIIDSYFGKPGKFKIKRIEYDRKTPHNKERTRFDNRGNFYLIYDGDGIENISEGVLYDEDKKHGLRFLFDRLNRLQKEKKQVFYTTKSRFATDGTAYDF